MKYKKSKKRIISEEVLSQVKQIEEMNISVRMERGHFKSGHCFLKDQQTLIINKNQSNELLESFLATFIEEHGKGKTATAS